MDTAGDRSQATGKKEESDVPTKDSPPAIKFSRRKGNKKSTRRKKKKRRRRDSSSDEETKVVAKKKTRTSLNTFTTAGARKGVEDVHIIKSTRDAAPVKYAGDATATTEIDTAHDRDGRALLEKHIELVGDGAASMSDKKVYKGQAGYSDFVKKSKDQVGLNKIKGTLGPLRAPKNVRNTCRFDYQPDVCKDYKDTGYCGFGDTCKFLHDRGDYKAGWQIERDWQEKQRRKQLGEDSDSDDDKYAIDSDEDELPFACHICREPFTNPIRTNCDHYFCLKCAMQRYKRTSTCAICKAQTGGIFNNAPKLQARIEAQKEEDEAAAGDDSDSSGGIAGEVDGSDAEESAAARKRRMTAEAAAAAKADADDGADIGGWEEVDSD